jgi:hypothetical protein
VLQPTLFKLEHYPIFADKITVSAICGRCVYLRSSLRVLLSKQLRTVQMIDTSIVRVHQHAACIARNKKQSMGRSGGELSSKIHAVVDKNGLPVRLALTAGEAHDNRFASWWASASSSSRSDA